MTPKLHAAFSAILLLLLGCSNAGDPPAGGEGDNPAYFPNRDGSNWSFRCQRYSNNVPSGDPYDYVEVFDGEKAVEGVDCQRLVASTPGISGYNVTYLSDDDDDEVMCWGREFSLPGEPNASVIFDPAWAALAYPLRVNRSWSEVKRHGMSPLALGLVADVDLDGKNDAVDVEIVRSCVEKEDLTIPIGTFEDCFKVRRTIYATFHMTTGGDVECTYVQYGWFKPGVGYVQFTGDDVTVPNGARFTLLAQLSAYEFPETAVP